LPTPTAVPIQSPSICISHFVEGPALDPGYHRELRVDQMAVDI